uniref:Uncharacterized protein n=1 Tax=Auxenochlorella protothecoides TaxID=3075 RepID=A0A1D1ZNC7_AUXPR
MASSPVRQPTRRVARKLLYNIPNSAIPVWADLPTRIVEHCQITSINSMFKEEAANRATLGSSFERDWSLAFCFPSEEPVAKPFEARLVDMSAEINEYMAVSNAYNMSAQVEEADAGPEFDMNLLPAEWRNPCHEELAALAVAEIASYIETESSSDSVISVSPASPAADGASWWAPAQSSVWAPSHRVTSRFLFAQ